MPLEVKGHTVPHWKDLRYGKDEIRGLTRGSISRICQDVLKSVNLLHNWGFVDSQMVGTVFEFGAQGVIKKRSLIDLFR